MKNTLLAAVTGLAYQAAAHATFQDLWVNGVDQISPHRSPPPLFFRRRKESPDRPADRSQTAPPALACP